jgi:hypothetical protein
MPIDNKLPTGLAEVDIIIAGGKFRQALAYTSDTDSSQEARPAASWPLV